jgi:2-haloacid dehalogenase
MRMTNCIGSSEAGHASGAREFTCVDLIVVMVCRTCDSSEMISRSQIDAVTFDCYGTLIDWESGIVEAIGRAFPFVSRPVTEVLRMYSEIEPVFQTGAYRKYRSVLREVLVEFGRRFGQAAVNPDALADSLADWRPFPDTVPALKWLRQHFKLGVISNIDDDLFAATAKTLEVPFDVVVTAEQVRCYKPSRRNFETALARLDRPPHRVLHVAESLFHDIAPVRELGIANVWVRRRPNGRSGASRTARVEPDLTVASLAEALEMLKG